MPATQPQAERKKVHPEEIYQAELAATEVSPAVARFMTWSFIAIILEYPFRSLRWRFRTETEVRRHCRSFSLLSRPAAMQFGRDGKALCRTCGRWLRVSTCTVSKRTWNAPPG